MRHHLAQCGIYNICSIKAKMFYFQINAHLLGGGVLPAFEGRTSFQAFPLVQYFQIFTHGFMCVHMTYNDTLSFSLKRIYLNITDIITDIILNLIQVFKWFILIFMSPHSTTINIYMQYSYNWFLKTCFPADRLKDSK